MTKTILSGVAFSALMALSSAAHAQIVIAVAGPMTGQYASFGEQMKNGADIRLAVDVVEDLFRLPDISHVVIAAGDSDYIALAQRAKRLGRYIVGIGVSGGTSKSLKAACNEYADYDALPGIRPAAHIAAEIDVASNDDAAAATIPRRASTTATTSATAESGENATSKRAASAR